MVPFVITIFYFAEYIFPSVILGLCSFSRKTGLNPNDCAAFSSNKKNKKSEEKERKRQKRKVESSAAQSAYPYAPSDYCFLTASRGTLCFFLSSQKHTESDIVDANISLVF